MSHADEGPWAKAELEKLKGVSAVRRALRAPKNYSDATDSFKAALIAAVDPLPAVAFVGGRSVTEGIIAGTVRFHEENLEFWAALFVEKIDNEEFSLQRLSPLLTATARVIDYGNCRPSIALSSDRVSEEVGWWVNEDADSSAEASRVAPTVLGTPQCAAKWWAQRLWHPWQRRLTLAATDIGVLDAYTTCAALALCFSEHQLSREDDRPVPESHLALCVAVLDKHEATACQISALKLAVSIATHFHTLDAIQCVLRFAIKRLQTNKRGKISSDSSAEERASKSLRLDPSPSTLDDIALDTLDASIVSALVSCFWTMFCAMPGDNLGQHIRNVMPELNLILSELSKLQTDTLPKKLVQLLGEQDDVLVSVLGQLFDLNRKLLEIGASDTVESWLSSLLQRPEVLSLCTTMSGRRLFRHFSEFVGHDHLVFLDLLLGDETEFLPYFLKYLKHIGPRGVTDTSRQDATLPDRVSADVVDSSLFEMLHKLRDTLQRMHSRGLFPYNVQPLLNRLSAVLDVDSA